MSVQETKIIIGMPVTVCIADPHADRGALEKVFSYFRSVDERFSTYKPESEISRINRGALKKSEWSDDMKTIFALSEHTKEETDGYFDIVNREGRYDPSGLVKGWAIRNAAKMLDAAGFENFFVDAGGDVEVRGMNDRGEMWSVGIRNPFAPKEIVKVVYLKDRGIATSGTYERGQHIYDPHEKGKEITDIMSFTVVGPDVYEADRFATAAFAMGKKGIAFIEAREGLEGYCILSDRHAIMTTHFGYYTVHAVDR